MPSLLMLGAIFFIATLMTMTGRGGGNFYVLAHVIAGSSMHTAAATGQLLMFSTSVAAALVFQKERLVVWPLAAFVACTTSVMAFVGGLVSYRFGGTFLELVFAILLVVAGFMMLRPAPKARTVPSGKRGLWYLTVGDDRVVVDLRIALPIALATGLVAGMVGISGGSFLVPLLVLACGLPMKRAVGTASVMVAATAAMGFLGHLSQGQIELHAVSPQVGVAALGGVLGGVLARMFRPRKLKKLFAYTTLVAALFMAWKALGV